MILETLYCTIPVSVYQTGRNSYLVHGRSLPREFVEIDGFTSSVFAACAGVRTFEEHAAACVLAGVSPNPATIASSLVRLISLGLLRATAHPECPPASLSPDKSIAVAVVTADRPLMLDRCLRSLTSHMKAVGRIARIVVVDGSRTCSYATETIVNSIAAIHGDIVYVGAVQAGRLRAQLVSQGLSEEVVTSALTPGAAGSNRNLALLWARTDVAVMFDDDVLCQPWASRREQSGIVVGGHVDLRESIWLSSRAQALSTVRYVDADLLGAHAAFLGRSLANIIQSTAGSVDAGGACQHMVNALATPEAYRVMATFAGIAGDGARYCPYSALLSSDETRQEFWRSEASLDLMLRSREVQRVARRPIVTHTGACMTYCLGVDLNAVMPPFIGAFRNADGVFGATLMAVYPDALFVHLPLGILHDSHRASVYDESQQMVYMQETRASDFLIDFILRSSSAIRSKGASERLATLGRALVDVAGLTTDLFLDALRDIAVSARSQEMMRLERLMHEQDCPRSLARAAERYRQAFREAIKEPAFFIPAEFRSDGPSALANVQTSFRRFGMAMLEWPTVHRHATRFISELPVC